MPWGWLPWAAWVRPFLCHLAWPHKHFMSCHKCCRGCRDVSEDIENCSTSNDKQHYSFLLHSEVHNIPEHQFCWARRNWASMMGIWVRRNVLASSLSLLPQATAVEGWVGLSHASLSVPEHSTDGHRGPIIRSACKMLWDHLFLLFTQINLLIHN